MSAYPDVPHLGNVDAHVLFYSSSHVKTETLSTSLYMEKMIIDAFIWDNTAGFANIQALA
jgi:hypothetical protein